jgi:hypothetical protein
VYNHQNMPMTDADDLSTPAEMADVLRRLTKIIRDVEALPDNAQEQFWDGTDKALSTVPTHELLLDAVASQRSVRALYALLVNLFGQELATMVNGEMAQYYEKMVAHMKEAAGQQSDWDDFLDHQFTATKDTDHEGVLRASVAIHTVGTIGHGSVRRVDGSRILKIIPDVGAGTRKRAERHFSSRDILTMEMLVDEGVEADSTKIYPMTEDDAKKLMTINMQKGERQTVQDE